MVRRMNEMICDNYGYMIAGKPFAKFSDFFYLTINKNTLKSSTEELS